MAGGAQGPGHPRGKGARAWGAPRLAWGCTGAGVAPVGCPWGHRDVTSGVRWARGQHSWGWGCRAQGRAVTSGIRSVTWRCRAEQGCPGGPQPGAEWGDHGWGSRVGVTGGVCRTHGWGCRWERGVPGPGGGAGVMKGGVPVPGCGVQLGGVPLPGWGVHVFPVLPRVGGAVPTSGCGARPGQARGARHSRRRCREGFRSCPGHGAARGSRRDRGVPPEPGVAPPRTPPPHAGSGVLRGGASPAAAPRGLGRASQ